MKKKKVIIAAASIAAVLCIGCLALALLTDTAPAPEATATTAAKATEPPTPTDTPAPTATPAPTSTPTPETFVTMDGYDSASESIIDPINLWLDYDDRSAGIAAKTNHGDRVKLVRREGDGVLVETAGGTRGWVTYYFIREFK